MIIAARKAKLGSKGSVRNRIWSIIINANLSVPIPTPTIGSDVFTIGCRDKNWQPYQDCLEKYKSINKIVRMRCRLVSEFHLPWLNGQRIAFSPNVKHLGVIMDI